MTSVRLVGVKKYYDGVKALDGIDFQVSSGEIFTLLGESGCGKTTTLRVIAGFEIPDDGRVYFDDRDVTFLKPYERNTAMVFQNYALWPHMRVYDNVAYGLRVRRLPEDEIRRRVMRVLDMMGIRHLANRYPSELSGGQQQRVALARAIVVEPDVLLLDEPLSNLDAQLRVKMREEILALQRRLGITTIYVTHDQEEALSISDRIAVMRRGRIEQIGTPYDVYNNPRTLYVATFIGRSSTIPGVVVEKQGEIVTLSTGLGPLRGVDQEGDLKAGEKAVAVVRPESFAVPPEREENVLRGRVELSMFTGWRYLVRIESGGVKVLIHYPGRRPPEPGSIIAASVSPEDVKVFRARE